MLKKSLKNLSRLSGADCIPLGTHEFLISEPESKQINLVCERESLVSVASAEEWILRNNINPNGKVLLCGYIAPEVMKHLISKEINYLELSGNCRIKNKSVFLFISGQKTRNLLVAGDEKTSQFKILTKSELKFISTLFIRPSILTENIREQAQLSKVATGSIGNIQEELKIAGFVDGSGTLPSYPKLEELFKRWKESYPKKIFNSMIIGRFIDRDNILKRPNSEFITSALIDGDPLSISVAYTDEAYDDIINKLGFEENNIGNVLLLRKFWSDDKLFTINHATKPIINYIDLLSLLTLSGLSEDEKEQVVKVSKMLYGKLLDKLKEDMSEYIVEQKDSLKKEEGLLSKQDVAKRLNVSIGTVDNRRKSGELRSIKIGSKILFRPEDLREYEESLSKK